MSDPVPRGRGFHRPGGDRSDSFSKRRAADDSMTLLNVVINNPIDPGYEAVAKRREDGGPRPISRPQRIVVLFMAAVMGLATTIAVVELRRPAPEIASRRAALEREITDRAATAEKLEATNAKVQGQIDDLETSLLGAGTGDGMSVISFAAGAEAVHGQGLVIEVSDAEPDSEGLVEQEGIVRDLDLQIIINGLWAAGAEAISINDRRLTTVSSIRNAGQAVLIDMQPVVQPYVIKAIGDPDTVQSQLARSSAGRYMQALRYNHKISLDIMAEDSIKVAAASAINLRYARASLGSSAAPEEPTDP